MAQLIRLLLVLRKLLSRTISIDVSLSGEPCLVHGDLGPFETAVELLIVEWLP